MSSTINASTASGGGVVTTADASGILALQTAGVTGLTIDASQKVTFANSLTGLVVGSMASSVLTSSTAVASTSGTSIDFTGIPSWAKRITVMLNGVSTNGTAGLRVQLGSTTFTTSGYLGSVTTGTTGIGTNNFTTGFDLAASLVSTVEIVHGNAIFTNISGNIWTGQGTLGTSNEARYFIFGGSVPLSGVLDRVRITTVNGTDTFDAGSINILYE